MQQSCLVSSGGRARSCGDLFSPRIMLGPLLLLVSCGGAMLSATGEWVQEPSKAPLRGCPGPCLSNSAEADWPQDGGSWEASPCSCCPALATARLARPVRVGRHRGPELARKDSGLQRARVLRGHADTSTRVGVSEHTGHTALGLSSEPGTPTLPLDPERSPGPPEVARVYVGPCGH